MKQFHGMLENTDFKNLQFVKKKTYHLNCNWKVFIDNYLGESILKSHYFSKNRESCRMYELSSDISYHFIRQ